MVFVTPSIVRALTVVCWHLGALLAFLYKRDSLAPLFEKSVSRPHLTRCHSSCIVISKDARFDAVDAYNMQISQDWNTFRWSRLTLLSFPAAKINQDEIRVLTALCVGVSNPTDPSNNCATKLEDVWKEHGFVGK